MEPNGSSSTTSATLSTPTKPSTAPTINLSLPNGTGTSGSPSRPLSPSPSRSPRLGPISPSNSVQDLVTHFEGLKGSTTSTSPVPSRSNSPAPPGASSSPSKMGAAKAEDVEHVNGVNGRDGAPTTSKEEPTSLDSGNSAIASTNGSSLLPSTSASPTLSTPKASSAPSTSTITEGEVLPVSPAQETSEDREEGEEDEELEEGEIAEPTKTSEKAMSKSASPDAPLSAVLARLGDMSEKDKEGVLRTVKMLSGIKESAKLPLTHGWSTYDIRHITVACPQLIESPSPSVFPYLSTALFFSDTSATSKPPVQSKRTSTTDSTAEEYSEAIQSIFTSRDVPALLGSYKSLQGKLRERFGSKESRRKSFIGGGGGGDGEDGIQGLGVSRLRPGQNWHFFREGVRPVWEDPWNEKGGRITLTPPLALLDVLFEAIILLLAGSVIEVDSSIPPSSATATTNNPNPTPSTPSTPSTKPYRPGTLVGIVASRRARGDRLELWMSGAEKGTAPDPAWVERVKEVLESELADLDLDGTSGSGDRTPGLKGGGGTDGIVTIIRASRYKKFF